jgi:hypothetical protein
MRVDPGWGGNWRLPRGHGSSALRLRQREYQQLLGRHPQGSSGWWSDRGGDGSLWIGMRRSGGVIRHRPHRRRGRCLCVRRHQRHQPGLRQRLEQREWSSVGKSTFSGGLGGGAGGYFWSDAGPAFSGLFWGEGASAIDARYNLPGEPFPFTSENAAAYTWGGATC